MIDHNHFICHCYSHFSVFSHTITWNSEEVWCPLLPLWVKPYHDTLAVLFLILSVINTAFVVCIENPQNFYLPIPSLYSWKRIMLLSSIEVYFKPSGPFFAGPFLSTFHNGSSFAARTLHTKQVDIPYFVKNFPLVLLVCMESAITYLTLTFISLPRARIRFLSHISSLNVFNEKFPMNNILSICVLLTFTPNSTILFPFLCDGTYIITLNANDAITNLSSFKHLLYQSCRHEAYLQ